MWRLSYRAYLAHDQEDWRRQINHLWILDELSGKKGEDYFCLIPQGRIKIKGWQLEELTLVLPKEYISKNEITG